MDLSQSPALGSMLSNCSTLLPFTALFYRWGNWGFGEARGLPEEVAEPRLSSSRSGHIRWQAELQGAEDVLLSPPGEPTVGVETG